VLSTYQNIERLASLGCLVKDKAAVHALTSLRAVGSDGRKVATLIDGRLRPIGSSYVRHAGQFPFSRVYESLSEAQANLEFDAGMVRLDDLNAVTSQIFGIGEPGPAVELSPASTGLDLIGLPVKSSGCISGVISGKIDGLFYRYRTAEGQDTICELLIGPRNDSPDSDNAERLARADSGAVWLIEDLDRFGPTLRRKRAPRPIACSLGAQRLESEVTSFALAASFSTVTKLLDVAIVRDLNIGLPTHWTSVKSLDGTDRNGAAKHVSPARAPKATSKRDVRIGRTSKKPQR
jgi:hypothetical protein